MLIHVILQDVHSTTAIESMKSRAQLGTGTHDALQPACPTSSVDRIGIFLSLIIMSKSALA